MGQERELGLITRKLNSKDESLETAKKAVEELNPQTFDFLASMFSHCQGYDDLPPEVANTAANILYRNLKDLHGSPGLSKNGDWDPETWLRDSEESAQNIADSSMLPEIIDFIQKQPRQTKHEQAIYEDGIKYFLEKFKRPDEIPGLYDIVRNKLNNSVQQNDKKLDRAEILPVAELEDAKEQYKRAVQYIDGEVVHRDFNEAAIWLRKAGAQGYADAQYLLGIMHEGGEGAEQDIQQATSYMRKAAEQGHTKAQVWLVAEEEKFKAANIAPEPSAQTHTTVATPLSKNGDYYWVLDLLPGLALGQSLSKGVLTIFHGSPAASSISLMLGGGVGYVLCRYARTQFTKNMQSRGAVISWSFAISFGLMLAILLTTVLLEKSAAPFDANSVVPDVIGDVSAPGYVAPQNQFDQFDAAPRSDPNQEYLKEIVKTFKEKCTDQKGIDFLNCWANYSPKKCKSLVYGQPVNPTWARCVYSCGNAGIYSKTVGECSE